MEVSKRQAKKIAKQAASKEKKRLLKEAGEWRSRKRRNQRDFHVAAKANEDVNQTSYVFYQGRRYVRPYQHNFQVYAKSRWFGKSVFELFKTEFGGYSDEYFVRNLKTHQANINTNNNTGQMQSIQEGRIRINENNVSPEYTIQDGDFIQHTTHRHEPPVVHDPKWPFVVSNQQDLIVVNKPATLPVHPCGPFRYNSVLFILQKEFGLENLHVVYRLDRFTSGLLILAKSVEKARILSQQIQSRKLRKTYLARVKGNFSIDHKNLPSICILDQEDGWWILNAPVRAVSRKENIRDCHIDGQDATTRFRFHSFNGTDSIVECQPITGRTHQIRVHLQLLGHPIANDPTYNGTNMTMINTPEDQYDVPIETSVKYNWCETCRLGLHKSFTPAQMQCEGIWLHALKYEAPDWSFQVDPPAWAVLELVQNNNPTT